jgi:hypothetical protein
METIALIQKLHELKKAVRFEDIETVKRLIDEAEECAVAIQRRCPEQLRRDSRSHLPSLLLSGH